MRWQQQSASPAKSGDGALPGMSLGEIAALPGHLRTVRVPEFQGTAFHEVIAKSALNRVPASSSMPFSWTVNPYRGCSHACVYCFARGSHRYLDFDTGADFDSQIIVKVNVAEMLGRELSRPGWLRESVALGSNTDPYQRAEGRYQLMPGIIDALTRSGTPFSILTKGTLLRRDLPRLVEARERVDVALATSIAVGDPELQHAIEPGTPGTRARLETVAAAREAGFGVTVFLMPVLPYLTDSAAHLAPLLRDIRDAGAASVIYGPLHLRTHVKPWFFAWLEATRPELVPRYRQLYPGSASAAPKWYRQELAGRIRPLIRRYGLAGTTPRARPIETAPSRRRGPEQLPSTSGPLPQATLGGPPAFAPGMSATLPAPTLF